MSVNYTAIFFVEEAAEQFAFIKANIIIRYWGQTTGDGYLHHVLFSSYFLASQKHLAACCWEQHAETYGLLI